MGNIFEYKGYKIQGTAKKGINGKWYTTVEITKMKDNRIEKTKFSADKCSSYILENEALKESENLGKKMIDLNMVGF